VAYFSISSTLYYIIRRIRDVPFQWMYLCFGVFIVACGVTHFMDVVTVWRADHFASAARRGVTLTVDAPPSLPAQMDPDQIGRVLMNLLSNAFKFTPPGGQIHCTLRTEEDTAVLEVADSGPGIPEAQREAVFERFRQLDGGPTRRHGGTGLGLAIARDLVALHRGTLTAGQAPPERLPCPYLICPRQRMWHLGLMACVHTILQVEDDQTIRETIAEVLRDEGYTVAEAANGQEALRWLAENPEPCFMPVMSGADFRARQLGDPHLSQIPVVVVSAIDGHRAADLRPSAFVPKPIDLGRLLTCIEQHC
jgi:CheY-like chemotaxis protein